jgi:hypothetical protein
VLSLDQILEIKMPDMHYHGDYSGAYHSEVFPLNDPTHICFFSKQTMRYLAQQWGVKVKFFANNVVLFVSWSNDLR